MGASFCFGNQCLGRVSWQLRASSFALPIIMEQQDVQLKWKWDDVQALVAQLLNAHEGPCLEAWIRKAKESSDHLRATTQKQVLEGDLAPSCQ